MRKPKLEIIRIYNEDVVCTSCICQNEFEGVNAPHLPHTNSLDELKEHFQTQTTVCQKYYDLFKTQIEDHYNRRNPIPGAVCEEHGQIYHLYNET